MRKPHILGLLFFLIIFITGIGLFFYFSNDLFAAGSDADKSPATPTKEISMENVKGESIVLGGGCFWCVEAVFTRVEGVNQAVSGYAGGTISNPSYSEVSSGKSGHAEVVMIDYDSKVISLAEILDIFFLAHDPTTLNRQGADTGTQYRSIILYKDSVQMQEAIAAIDRARPNYKDKIVTELKPLGPVFMAEEYHQDYYELNKNAAYCQIVISPKLKKLNLE